MAKLVPTCTRYSTSCLAYAMSTVEELKAQGNAAYAQNDHQSAVDLYTK